jgi:hypothetical protein
MIITLCASLKFSEQIEDIKNKLEKLGHSVYIPIKVPGVNYWDTNGEKRVAVKQSQDLISEHMKKIEKSDAILVINISKHEIANYIGANTFMEIGFAHYLTKKIFILNPLPDQPYIIEELLSMKPIIIDNELEKI